MCIRDSGKADKQLQSLLWSLDFCKISAGTHHTHNKEQHEPVSYTHLDVYKRQIGCSGTACNPVTDLQAVLF